MYGHGCTLKRLLRPAVEAYLDEPTCTLAAQRAGIQPKSFAAEHLPVTEWAKLADLVAK